MITGTLCACGRETNEKLNDKKGVALFSSEVSAERYLMNEILPQYEQQEKQMTLTYYGQTYTNYKEKGGSGYSHISVDGYYELEQAKEWLLAYNVADYNGDHIEDLFTITLGKIIDGEIGPIGIENSIYFFDNTGKVKHKYQHMDCLSVREEKVAFAFIDDKLIKFQSGDYSSSIEENEGDIVEYIITDDIRYYTDTINVMGYDSESNEMKSEVRFSRSIKPSGEVSWDDGYSYCNTETEALEAVQRALKNINITEIKIPLSVTWDDRWNNTFYVADTENKNAVILTTTPTVSKRCEGIDKLESYHKLNEFQTITGEMLIKYDAYEAKQDIKGKRIITVEDVSDDDVLTGIDYGQFYKPVIESCKIKIGYDSLEDYYKNECNGLLEDLNNDGIKELIITYFDNYDRRCEIWTVKEGKASCILDILAGYFASEGSGAYLDLMKFKGKNYLTFFNRTIANALDQETWIFYGLTENGYSKEHVLQIDYSYEDTNGNSSVPITSVRSLDGNKIKEEEFWNICPEKIGDIINLGGENLDEDLLNSVSDFYYNVRFIDREAGLDTLLSQLEVKKEKTEKIYLEIYGDFINNRSYEKYIDAFFGKPESYTMIDIAGKTLPILLINSERDEMGYSWTLVFGYDTNAGEVIYLDSFSHYGEIMYSQDFSALAFSEWETTEDRGEIGYYTIFDNELQNILLIEWDMTVSKDNNYTSTSAFVNQISESRRMEYLKELKELDFRKIT